MAKDKRYVVDCRNHPDSTGCTLTLSGTEEEVIECAAQHAVAVHGEEDSDELRATIRDLMVEEEEPLLV